MTLYKAESGQTLAVTLYKAASGQTQAQLGTVKQFGSISYKLIGLNCVYTNFPLNKIIKIKTILLRSKYKHKTNY